MPVQIIQMFAPTVLTTSAATLFTASGATLNRGRIRFTNTSGSNVTVTAYGIPNGGTAGPGNEFLVAQTVLAGANLDVDVPVLAPGGFIQALASAGTSVTAHSLDGVLSS